MTIRTRGKPESAVHPDRVHYFEPTATDTSWHNPQRLAKNLACRCANYHIRYSDIISEVTCEQCREQISKHLVFLAGKLPNDQAR